MIILHWADYAVFGFLLLISALVGPFYMWRERNRVATSESYFTGDRSLHIIPTAASLFASFWSAIALVGIPAELYKGGAKFFVSSLGQAIGIGVAAFVAVPVIYKLKLISSFQYFEMRFKSRTLRIVGTICNFLANIAYLAVVTYTPCISLSAVTPIPLWVSVVGTATITMIYTVLGGIKAVVMVDLLQAVVMFAGVIIGIVVGFSKIDGGVSRAFEIAKDGGRLDFFDFNPDPTNTYNFWIMTFPSIIGTAGVYATSQAAVQRYSALPTLKLAKTAVLAMAPQIIILKLMLFAMAIAMFAFYDSLGCHPLQGKIIDNENQLTTFYIAHILDFPGLIGLWFAAIFSGSLSSMSTGYNSAAACLWEDILKNFKFAKKLSKREVSILLKVITLGLGVFTCLLALMFQFIEGSVIQLTNSTVSIFGAAIYIAFFNGALFPMTNAIGTMCGMVVSALIIIFIAGGQMLFSLGNKGGKEIDYPLSTANCSSMIAELVAAGRYKIDEVAKKTATGATCALLLTSSTVAPIMENQMSVIGTNNLTVYQNSSVPSQVQHNFRFIRQAENEASWLDSFFASGDSEDVEGSGLDPSTTTKKADVEIASTDPITVVNTVATTSVQDVKEKQTPAVFNVNVVEAAHEVEESTTVVNNQTTNGEGIPPECEKKTTWRDELREKLPAALTYIFSISYFIFPFMALLVGTIFSISISLCTGGLKLAKTIHPRYMIVPNCFYKAERTIESWHLENIDDYETQAGSGPRSRTNKIDKAGGDVSKPILTDYSYKNPTKTAIDHSDDDEDDRNYVNSGVNNPIYSRYPNNTNG